VSAEERPQLQRLGSSVADRLTDWLTEAGVRLLLGVDVAEIKDGTTVVTTDGQEVSGDLLLSAAGVSPNSELAERAGLRVDDGRIVVDEQMATNSPRIFAAGDVALARNGSAGRALRVEHWGEGLRMGEVAGNRAAGGTDEWTDVPGFWSEIGKRTLKYAAWGDGFERHDLVQHDNGGFSVWYSAGGKVVGVLTHDADDDYERGRELILSGAG
jgi:NADPH-dependent 2,4-dienoyl-CoA reductase/sulfur reductase-like enzyme